VNLHALRIFTLVARERSFSRAAELLFLSQPAVSRAIRELEQEQGVELFDRTARPPAVTTAGAVLLAHATQLFAAERAAERAMAELRDLQSGSLAIGASSTIGIYLLPAQLAEFQQQRPQLRLFLDIGNTQQILDRLCMAELDIALVEGPAERPQLEQTIWRADQLVVIAPPGHPLSGRRSVAAQQLADYPFILRESGSGTREVIEAALRRADLTLQVRLELGSTEAIKRAVAAGMGLAIVSQMTVADELRSGRLAAIDLRDLPLERELRLVTVRGRPLTPAAQALRRQLLAAAQPASTFRR
jgi:DNA-binding transcriptional LysR family regulator